jgi:hypothetical protein
MQFDTPSPSFDRAASFAIDGFHLALTCEFCPEQYDVWKGKSKVGYIRPRHGMFRAECYGDTVLSGSPEGDGSFADAAERERYLRDAVASIKRAMRREKGQP